MNEKVGCDVCGKKCDGLYCRKHRLALDLPDQAEVWMQEREGFVPEPDSDDWQRLYQEWLNKEFSG